MKQILFLIMFSIYSFASLINAIAVTVDDRPITLLDIDKTMNLYHIDKIQAIDLLIREQLEAIEIEKFNISVSDYDVYNYINKLALSQGVTYSQIKAIATKEYGSFDNYMKLTKKNMLKEQLYKKIARNKITNVTEDDMKIYYENNKELFNIASKIEVIEYFSKNPTLLEEVKKNPLLNLKDVIQNVKTYYQDKMNNTQKYILNNLKVGEFSAIMPLKNGYMMSYIKNKSDITSLSFNSVKDKIYSILMKEREDNIVKEYFQRLRLNSDIRILR